MANIRKWMASARRLESEGDLQGAIATYRKALVAQEETSGFADLGLINGLGDLYRRAGRQHEALQAYERAAAQCEEQQLYANGIALCKKILRNAPDATPVYRRAGRLYALSGLMADARASYDAYIARLSEAEERDAVRAAREELVDLVGSADVAVELAGERADAGRVDEALELLRAVRDRRDREGRDVVALVRAIQDLSGRVEDGAGDRGGDPAPTATGTRARRRGIVGDTDGDPAAPDDADAESLGRELRDVLSRLEGEERLRRALPLIDHLLSMEPGRFDLLHRKLGYAYEIGEEAAVVEAYLALGECLDATLDCFQLRSLSTSTDTGTVTAAIKVERLADLAPGS